MRLNFFKSALALTVALSTVIFSASSAFAEPIHQQVDFKVNQPPKDFNAENASDNDLQKYGLPKRPTDPQQLAIWNEHMKHAKNFIYPQFETVPISHKKSKQISNTLYSYNWSGYEAQDGGYTKISGDWTVSDVSSSTNTSYDSTWVGIGGDNNDYLIQAGTESQITVTNSTTKTTNYYPWWQMLPDYQYENKITSFSISPGDSMYVHIEYDSTNNCANFLVQDLTTNNYTSFCALHANNDYTTGPTAEWVVERPTVNGSYTKLADFGSETFTNAYAATPSSSLALGAWTNDTLYMQDIFNIQLAHPGSLLSSTSFTDYWDNYGN